MSSNTCKWQLVPTKMQMNEDRLKEPIANCSALCIPTSLASQPQLVVIERKQRGMRLAFIARQRNTMNYFISIGAALFFAVSSNALAKPAMDVSDLNSYQQELKQFRGEFGGSIDIPDVPLLPLRDGTTHKVPVQRWNAFGRADRKSDPTIQCGVVHHIAPALSGEYRNHGRGTRPDLRRRVRSVALPARKEATACGNGDTNQTTRI